LNEWERVLVSALLASDSLDGELRSSKSAGAARLWLLNDPVWFAMQRHAGATTSRFAVDWNDSMSATLSVRDVKPIHVGELTDFAFDDSGRLIDFSLDGVPISRKRRALSSAIGVSGILQTGIEGWNATFWPTGGLPHKMPWTRRTTLLENFEIEVRTTTTPITAQAGGEVYVSRRQALGGTVRFALDPSLVPGDVVSIDVHGSGLVSFRLDVCASLDDEPFPSTAAATSKPLPAALEPRAIECLAELAPYWWHTLAESERVVHLAEVARWYRRFTGVAGKQDRIEYACGACLVEIRQVGGDLP
jgi:hypothetical protein